MQFPKSFYAGDDVEFRSSLTGELAVNLSGPGGRYAIPITAGVGKIGAATSALMTTGKYRATLIRRDEEGERSVIASATITVLADPESETVTDHRTHARRILDAIEATLEGRATNAHAAVTLADGRSVTLLNPSELLTLRDRYLREVRSEETANSGRGAFRKIRAIL